MADSGGKQTGIVGRLRNMRDRRRQRRAEKAHANSNPPRLTQRRRPTGRRRLAVLGSFASHSA